MVTSLPAERAAGYAKKLPSKRISLISSISRMYGMSEFSRWREPQAVAIRSADDELRRLKTMGWPAFNFKLNSELVLVGRRV